MKFVSNGLRPLADCIPSGLVGATGKFVLDGLRSYKAGNVIMNFGLWIFDAKKLHPIMTVGLFEALLNLILS